MTKKLSLKEALQQINGKTEEVKTEKKMSFSEALSMAKKPKLTVRNPYTGEQKNYSDLEPAPSKQYVGPTSQKPLKASEMSYDDFSLNLAPDTQTSASTPGVVRGIKWNLQNRPDGPIGDTISAPKGAPYEQNKTTPEIDDFNQTVRQEAYDKWAAGRTDTDIENRKVIAQEMIPETSRDFRFAGNALAYGGTKMVEWVAPKAFTPYLSDKASQFEENMRIVQVEDPAFANDLRGGAASMAAFFIPGFGIARGTRAIAKFSPKLARILGATMSTLLESSVEAGSVYGEVQKITGDDKLASQAAMNTFIANAAIIYLTNRLGVFSDEAQSGVKKFLYSAFNESGQEFSQSVIQNLNTDNPMFEGAAEAALIGALLGGPTGVIGGRLMNLENYDPAIIKGIIEQRFGGGQDKTTSPYVNLENTIQRGVGQPEISMNLPPKTTEFSDFLGQQAQRRQDAGAAETARARFGSFLDSKRPPAPVQTEPAINTNIAERIATRSEEPKAAPKPEYIGYRTDNIGGPSTGQAGVFYSLTRLRDGDRTVRVSFDNPLFLKKGEYDEGLPAEALVPRFGITEKDIDRAKGLLRTEEDGEAIDYLVALGASKAGYDGVVYEGYEIQDLRNFRPRQEQTNRQEQKRQESQTAPDTAEAKTVKTERQIPIQERPKTLKAAIVQAKQPETENTVARIRELAERGKTQIKAQTKAIQKEQVKKPAAKKEKKKEPVRGEMPEHMQLARQLEADMKAGKDETYFREMEFDMYAKFLEGKISGPMYKTVEKFIEKHFEDANTAFYSKQAGSIEGYAKRGQSLKEEKATLHDMIYPLIKKYGRRVTEKYVPRGAAGVHYADTHNIAVKSISSLPLVVHELAHAIDVRHGISDKIAKESSILVKELRKVYLEHYIGANKGAKRSVYIKEGFASFVERSLAEPNRMAAEYPYLTGGIMKESGRYRNDELDAMLKDFGNVVEQYQGFSNLDKFGARMWYNNKQLPNKTFISTADNARTMMFDYIWNLERADIEAGTQWTDQSMSLALRGYNAANNVFLNNMSQSKHGFWTLANDGSYQKTLPYNWHDLITLLESENVTREFGEFLIARRAYYNNKKYAELIKNDKKKEAKELLEIIRNDNFDFELTNATYNENKKRFEGLTQMYDTLNRESIRVLANPLVRLKTQEQVNEYLDDKGYATFYRHITDEFAETIRTIYKPNTSTSASSLRSRTGSEKPIIHPVLGAAFAHGEIIKKAQKQIVYNLMYENRLQNRLPDVFQEQSIEAVPLKQDGPMMFPQAQDPNTVIVTDKAGKRHALRIHQEIQKVLDTAFDTRTTHLLIRLMKFHNRIFVKGTTTLYAPFGLVTNPSMDWQTSVAQTRNRSLPVISASQELYRAVMGGKQQPDLKQYMSEFFVLGGHTQTFTRSFDLSPADQLKAIAKERGKIEKITRNVLKTGEDILGAPAQGSELMTRLVEYIRARRSGKSQAIALREASMVSVTFGDIGSLGGKFGRDMIRAYSYGNVPLQVTHSMIRALESKETRPQAQLLMLLLFVLNAAGMAARVKQFKDLEEGKVSGREKEILENKLNAYRSLSTWEMSNYIYKPNDDGSMFRVRTPSNWNLFSAISNLVVTDLYLEGDYDKDDYSDMIQDMFLPNELQLIRFSKEGYAQLALSVLTPRAIKAEVTTLFGKKDFPSYKDIEPLGMTYKLPEERFYEHTNALAVALGKTFNISPLLVEHYLKEKLGRTFMVGTDAFEPEAWLKRQQRAFEAPLIHHHRMLYGNTFDKLQEKKIEIEKMYKRDKEKTKDAKEVVDATIELKNMYWQLTNADITVPDRYINDITEIASLINKDKFEEATELFRALPKTEIRAFIRENSKTIKK